MVVINILLVLCYAALQAADPSGIDDRRQKLDARSLNLLSYQQDLQKVLARANSISEEATRVEDHFRKTVLETGAKEALNHYEEDLATAFKTASGIDADFLRLVIPLHYAGSPNTRMTFDPAILQDLKDMSDRNMVFLVTQNGDLNVEDIVTLMLSEEPRYPLILPTSFDDSLNDHLVFENWSSHLLLKQLGGYHPMQEAMVKGHYAKYFDIVLKNFRILWGDALRVQQENPDKFNAVKDYLFWFLGQDHRYLSEYMGDFKENPLRKLGLEVPDSAYMNPNTVRMMTGCQVSQGIRTKSITDFNVEMDLISKIGLEHVKKCQMHSSVQGALQEINGRLQSQFWKETSGKVAKLDLTALPAQTKFLNNFQGMVPVLEALAVGYEERRSGEYRTYPRSATIEEACKEIAQDNPSVLQLELKMQLIAYAKLLKEMRANYYNARWFSDLKTTLYYTFMDDHPEMIPANLLFKIYKSSDAVEQKSAAEQTVTIQVERTSVWNAEEQIVTIVRTGRPLIPFDADLEEPFEMTRILESFDDEGLEQRMKPVREVIDSYVEEALSQPRSHFRDSILHNLYQAYYSHSLKTRDHHDPYRYYSCALTPRPTNPDYKTMGDKMQAFIDQCAVDGYLQTACRWQKMGFASRSGLTDVMNPRLYSLKRQVYGLEVAEGVVQEMEQD
ncbi:MAG: hypothetical protein OXC30_03250 [Alphaproteobacteria bacterium]|nr:hypothetical protein [Alphaproteobacteria bacterium]